MGGACLQLAIRAKLGHPSEARTGQALSPANPYFLSFSVRRRLFLAGPATRVSGVSALGGTDSGGLLPVQLPEGGEGIPRPVGLTGTPVGRSQGRVDRPVSWIQLAARLKLRDGVPDPVHRQIDPAEGDVRTGVTGPFDNGLFQHLLRLAEFRRGSRRRPGAQQSLTQHGQQEVVGIACPYALASGADNVLHLAGLESLLGSRDIGDIGLGSEFLRP